MSNIAIKVQNLSKVYKLYDKPIDRLKESLHPFKKKYHKDFYALNDVSFEIKKGETVGIIGKNGAGKSTLLKIITGVLTPSSGHVHVNGRIASLLELGAGFNPEYTGVENIYLQGTLMGYTHEEMESKIQAILDFADIGDFVYQPVKSYSSGMFARLAFAVNINVDPDILIVDEALAVGDMNFQAKCMTAMDRIKQKGTTIFFVSHDIGSVKSLCDKGIYIKNGVMHAIGKASDVAEMFIKEMRENLNEEHKKFARVSTTFSDTNKEQKEKTQSLKKSNLEFKTSEDFDKKVAQFRYGSGGAKITFVELLDMDDKPVVEAEFNQEVKLRIYFKSEIEDNLSVNYYVSDDKRNLIFGGGPRLFGKDLLKIKKDGRYCVEYKFKLPLHEGMHSIQIQLSLPIIINQTADFADVVDDAIVFTMQQKENVKLWTKVFVPSEYKVTQL